MSMVIVVVIGIDGGVALDCFTVRDVSNILLSTFVKILTGTTRPIF